MAGRDAPTVRVTPEKARELVSLFDSDFEFRLWVEDRLTRRRMSRRDLATRAGLSHTTVSRLLTRRRKDPLLSTALRIIEVLL